MSSHVVVEAPTGAEAPADEGNEVAERPENVPEKFWNAETGEVNHDEVLKSYNELESKNSQATDDGEGSAEDTSENDDVVDATPEGESSNLDTVLEAQGINRSDLSDELASDGELSQASYDKLEAAGYDKATVDSYIAGNKALYDSVQSDISEVMESVDNFDAMSDWASKNLTNAQLKSYNDMVTSGDKVQAQAGVNFVNGLFSEAVGDDVSLLGGDQLSTESTDVFRSNAEVTKAMGDPRYAKDSAYRDDVARKLARSSVL